MTRKTDGERIDDIQKAVAEVEKLVAGILEQLKHVGKSLDALNDARGETGQLLNDLRREAEKELVVLKRDVEELRRWAERNGTAEVKSDMKSLAQTVGDLRESQRTAGTRAWAIVPNLVGAVVSGLIAWGVAYFVARR